jgi:hypothetical protein
MNKGALVWHLHYVCQGKFLMLSKNNALVLGEGFGMALESEIRQ